MGIQGLTTYSESIVSLWTRTQLKDTRVIIDGSSLLWYLYLDDKLDCRCGGQYDEFAWVIERFFKSLTSKRVEPYIVVDGPTIISDKKLPRIIERSESDIQSSYKLSKGDVATVLPRMAKLLFLQTMEKLKVPFVICDCEADQEVARLAFQWQCPVLSNDSDFLIFDLPAGYIPLKSLDWKGQVVSAKLYKRENMAKNLGIPEDFLPLFASLVGNDYMEKQILAPFERALLRTQTSGNCRGKFARIKNVASLLSKSRVVSEACRFVLDLIKNVNEKAKLKSALEESVKGYKNTDSSLSGFLELGETRTDLKTLQNNAIPVQVIKRYREGLFSSEYMGVLVAGRRILKIQVEDFTVKSANCCAMRLRRINYGIIAERVSGTSENTRVKEWNRGGKVLRNYRVIPFDEPIHGFGELPSLESLEDFEEKQKGQLLLAILEADTKAIKNIPDFSKLFAASIRYWISKAEPRVDQTCAQALILRHLQLRVECATLSCTSRKFKSCLFSTFDIKSQHSFAQWQAVMSEAIFLNQILVDPLPAPDIATLYSGVTAQVIVQELRQGKHPESLIETADMANDYEKLYSAATEGLTEKLSRPASKDVVEVATRGKTRERRHTKQNEIPKELQGNPYALLCGSQSDSDES